MAKVARIPVIDISGGGDEAQVAKDLVEAAIEHGFVYLKNTGSDIPVAAIDGAFETVWVVLIPCVVLLCRYGMKPSLTVGINC